MFRAWFWGLTVEGLLFACFGAAFLAITGAQLQIILGWIIWDRCFIFFVLFVWFMLRLWMDWVNYAQYSTSTRLFQSGMSNPPFPCPVSCVLFQFCCYSIMITSLSSVLGCVCSIVVTFLSCEIVDIAYSLCFRWWRSNAFLIPCSLFCYYVFFAWGFLSWFCSIISILRGELNLVWQGKEALAPLLVCS